MKEINNMNIRNVSILGIIICCIYFIVVITFVITSSMNWLIKLFLQDQIKIWNIKQLISGMNF